VDGGYFSDLLIQVNSRRRRRRSAPTKAGAVDPSIPVEKAVEGEPEGETEKMWIAVDSPARSPAQREA
jgi:hypothetical protein